MAMKHLPSATGTSRQQKDNVTWHKDIVELGVSIYFKVFMLGFKTVVP
jgi:hypothetical protein